MRSIIPGLLLLDKLLLRVKSKGLSQGMQDHFGAKSANWLAARYQNCQPRF